MCGITGVLAFNQQGKSFLNKVGAAVKTLADGEGVYQHETIALGHTRLAVIDTSVATSQPFSDRRTSLRSMIENDLPSDTFVEEQNLFNVEAIKRVKAKLFSANPGDTPAQVWGLIVFQHWWKRTMMNKL